MTTSHLFDGWLTKVQSMLGNEPKILYGEKTKYILKYPIEIAPLESFKVKVSWPLSRQEMACCCPTQLLMRSGCKCGGK